MKKRTRTLLTRCLIPGLFGVIAAPTVLPPPSVIADSSQPISLTFQEISSDTGKIQVSFGSGTQSVLLPDGTKVTSSTSIQVTNNGEYDFVAYDTNGRPTQQTITVSGLDVDPAPVTIAEGLYFKLHVAAFDSISQMNSYRYKLDDASSWSDWTPYQDTNSHEIKIPVTSRTDSFVGDRSVMVEFKDNAGNIKSVETPFRVDHYYPEIESYNKTIYTNTGHISIPLVTDSYFKNPDKLTIEEGSKVTTKDLTQIDPTETLLSRRPNQYKADWGNDITYDVDKTQGLKKLNLTVSKSYTDFKGNRVDLSSDEATETVLNVVYDTEKPTGTVHIEANSKGEVLSHEVTVDLSFKDEMSGVDTVRVYEKGTNKEYYLTPDEIKTGNVKIPWVLSLDKDGQVMMDVTDKAGNTATFESNKVTVSNIQVTGFDLTNVVNPAADFPDKGYSWQFDGNNVHMIAGGNFTFNIYYDLGFVDPNRFVVSGTYKVTMVDDNGVVYESADIPYKQGFDEDNSMGDAGFTATFTLPSKKANGEPFNDGTKVYISSTLKRVEKADGSTLTTKFENPNTIGNFIGVVGHYNGAMSIDDMVRFNEKN